MSQATPVLSEQEIETYQTQGVLLLRGVFVDWLDTLKAAVAENLDNPGPYFADNTAAEEGGRFWDDYCNWQRIAGYRAVIEQSAAGAIAAQVMRSKRAQFFHEHVLVKAPSTSKPTPWHQDAPYYFVDGQQSVSFWIPLDPVSEDNTLRFVKGSHRWKKPVKPVRWASGGDFYEGESDSYQGIPDDDTIEQSGNVVGWAMQPGDAVLFHFSTVHGARGNHSERERRAFSMRWVGDDARYVARPGRTSPPFPGHDMQSGQRLREDWFPTLWPQEIRA